MDLTLNLLHSRDQLGDREQFNSYMNACYMTVVALKASRESLGSLVHGVIHMGKSKIRSW